VSKRVGVFTQARPSRVDAFSTLGFSASFAGFGSSPTVRPNTAFTTYQNFRAAAQVQVGGYGIGNATNGMYQAQLGADFGALSVDGVMSWAKDAVTLGSQSDAVEQFRHRTRREIQMGPLHILRRLDFTRG
jgi:hypothetical protein